MVRALILQRASAGAGPALSALSGSGATLFYSELPEHPEHTTHCSGLNQQSEQGNFDVLHYARPFANALMLMRSHIRLLGDGAGVDTRSGIVEIART
jgi:hypothetical protein